MKKEMKIVLPFYKIAYAVSFVVILSLIRGVVFTNEIGLSIEAPFAILTAVFCFLYAGSMKNLTEEAQGKIWICKVPDERKAREVEQKYRITSKQYVEGGLQLRVISEIQPELECMSIPATLEDAYIYVTNQYE